MADEHKSPVDQALDLIVFAPVGLALTAKDELPNLIAKGRQRVEAQLTMFRFIGRFAVSQGQKEAEKVISQMVEHAGVIAERLGAVGSGVPGGGGGGAGVEGQTGRASTPAAPAPRQTSAARRAATLSGAEESAGEGAAAANGGSGAANGGSGAANAGSGGANSGSGAANGGSTVANGPSANGLLAAGLAIPGYDSLSASQVVQRLAGLSPEELDDVGRYEDAHRGRRTILSKVSQLQADRS